MTPPGSGSLALDEGLRLLPHDVDEVAQRQVDVDEVEAPARVHLAVRDHVPGDVVGARIRRVVCRQVSGLVLTHLLVPRRQCVDLACRTGETKGRLEVFIAARSPQAAIRVDDQ